MIEYRALKGFYGYYAGSDGYIYSRRKIGNNQQGISLQDNYRRLKNRISTGGGSATPYVQLPYSSDPVRHKNYSVSVLVIEAFKGPRPDGLECSHLDGNKLNNRPENLVWENHQENCKRRLGQGSQPHGVNHGMSSLTVEDLHLIRTLLSQGEMTQQAIADFVGTTQTTVYRIKNRKTYIHM